MIARALGNYQISYVKNKNIETSKNMKIYVESFQDTHLMPTIWSCIKIEWNASLTGLFEPIIAFVQCR